MVGLLLAGLGLFLVKPVPVSGQEAQVQFSVEVRPMLATEVTSAPGQFTVTEANRGRRVSLPIAGEVSSNLRWFMVLQLPDTITGPGGYVIPGQTARLERVPEVDGLSDVGSGLAVLAGKRAEDQAFENRLVIDIPRNAPAGVYRLPLYLSVIPSEQDESFGR